MSDIPENLRVIKKETSPPQPQPPPPPTTTTTTTSTPERTQSPNNSIKARLNLHVKRRLQQDLSSHTSSESSSVGRSAAADKRIGLQKETAKQQRRPYQKRTDKTKVLTAATAPSGLAELPAVRKYRRHKVKLGSTCPPKPTASVSVAQHLKNVESTLPSGGGGGGSNAGAASAGDDEDGGGGNEAEMRSSRDREKYPDVLGMVLSMKKNALLKDPEVRDFLAKVMDVIKS